MSYPGIIYQNANLLQCVTSGLALTDSRLSFVAVRGGRIVAIGPAEAASSMKGRGTRVVDCHGYTLLPGLVDAHCHFLALASRLSAIDCGRERASTIPQLVNIIAQESSKARSKEWDGRGWIRAFGYDEFYLKEKHHPTRWDLDQVSLSYPVRLDHRTGHAMVLNSVAMSLLQITKDTSDPIDGVIQRDEDSREPTGVLLEMARWVRNRLGHTRSEDEVRQGARLASRCFLSKGVTSIQDATPSNGPEQWDLFSELKGSGCLVPRVTMMVGADCANTAKRAAMRSREETGLRLGATKIMVTLTTGALQPSEEELRELVLREHSQGSQVAVHAVEAEAVEAVADALLHAQSVALRPDARHRIEHCSECPPHLVDKIAASGAVVVTQPGFICDVGERYASLADERFLPHLYPIADLAAAGVLIGAGSDAPVTLPDPMASIYAAVTRMTSSGICLGPGQGVPVEEAIVMHTRGGAFASFEEHRKGTIKEGNLADFVLLEQDPTAVEPGALRDIRPLMTVVNGEVVWQA
ncbi:MAG: amidohydrolase [Dehalococcoidia bacterium]|nr:amidohydrolase [Dehalococcoidia bacterium]